MFDYYLMHKIIITFHTKLVDIGILYVHINKFELFKFGLRYIR